MFIKNVSVSLLMIIFDLKNGALPWQGRSALPANSFVAGSTSLPQCPIAVAVVAAAVAAAAAVLLLGAAPQQLHLLPSANSPPSHPDLNLSANLPPAAEMAAAEMAAAELAAAELAAAILLQALEPAESRP